MVHTGEMTAQNPAPERAKHVPNWLNTARNVLAGSGCVLLLLGLVLHAADGPATVPIWLGLISAAAAAGIAIASRPMPVGARIVTVVAVVAVALVLIDLIN